MLEKPALSDEKISACLQEEYNLPVDQVTFLPLGADRNTAVYRVIARDGTPYFLKLRSGLFDEISVELPKFLGRQGIAQIIVPLATKTGQLWASLDIFKMILYPFVEGHDGYEVDLKERQWVDFGMALKRIHSLKVPAGLVRRIQRETYSPVSRELTRTFLYLVEENIYFDPITIKLAAFLKTKHAVVLDLVERAERLAKNLQECTPEFILCHSDIHAGNILIDAKEAVHIVDWDAPILAPKERDLMSIGGGLFGGWRSPQEEETLFYKGYGQTQINPDALAYYRYERIIADLAVECGQILLKKGSGEDREQAFKFLESNFLPNNTIEIAYKSDKTVRN